MDLIVQNSDIDKTSELYKSWDQFYMVYSMLDAGVGGASGGLSAYRALRSVNLVKSYNRFNAAFNVAKAETKAVLKEDFNTFKNILKGGAINSVGGKLSKYVNLLESLKYKRVKRVLSDNEIITLRKNLENAHPDVLKHIDELDEFDFVEMIKGYKDNPEKFNLAIKNAPDFIGTSTRPGFLAFWKLTPKIKDGLRTIIKLKNSNKLLPTGNATQIQLACIQNYTAWGNFVNVPMRFGVHFGKYASKAKVHIERGLELLRKVPERNMAGKDVFSGRAYSQADFDNLFVGKKGMEVEINKGFVSSSLSEDVATHFANITSSSQNNIKVIRRIETKTGVYLDDLADYGKNLGPVRHADQPPIAQIQKEVLMKEGLFKQLSEPKLFKEVDGVKWYYIDFIELGKPLK